jgi:transposase InsO family protein
MAPRKQKETVVSKILTKLYYDPKSSASYGGKKTLETALEEELKRRRLVRKKLPTLVEKWLEDQPTYTLHKQPRRNFPRRRVIVGGINDQWQCDLMDVQALSNENAGYKYILMVVDCFTRKAWARALKDKSGKSVADAFSDIFRDQTPPNKIQVDRGLEFYNSHVKSLFKKHNVKLFSTEDYTTKASLCERLIRTIKRRMYGYFHAKKTRQWFKVLDDLILSYNNKIHSVIKFAPNKVNQDNAHIVRMNNEYNRGKGVHLRKHKHKHKPVKSSKNHKRTKDLRLGDLVRISAAARLFKKGYLPQWTQELFTVTNVIDTVPVVYKLKDTSGEVISGTFYLEELQKVTSMPRVFEIEEILEQKGKNILVKWKGYPSSMNQWIHKSALRRI